MKISVAPGKTGPDNSSAGLDRFPDIAGDLEQGHGTDIAAGVEYIGRTIVMHQRQAHTPAAGRAGIITAMQPEIVVSITAGDDPAGTFDVDHFLDGINSRAAFKSGLAVPAETESCRIGCVAFAFEFPPSGNKRRSESRIDIGPQPFIPILIVSDHSFIAVICNVVIVVVGRIHQQSFTAGIEQIFTVDALGFFPGLLQSGQQHGGQNGNNSNHNQKFDQCKKGSFFARH